MSIKKKLIIVILGLVIIVTFFVSAISYLSAKNALERATLMSLNIIGDSKEGQLFLYLKKLKDRAIDFSSDGFIRDSLVTISAQDSIDTIEKLNVHLIKNKKSLDGNILAIDVLDLNGKIVASTDTQRIGLDQHKEKYFIAGKRELYVQNIREEPDETFHLNVSVPLTHREKPTEVIGVIVNHYNAKAISSLLSGEKTLEMRAKTQLRGIGETGETYIVNKDKFMITDSIFIRNAIFNVKVDTFPVKKCFEDNEEVKGVWLNYRGVPVAGVSMCMTVGDFTWVLISEQGIAEIFLPIYNLRKLLFIIGTITLFLVVLVVLSIAQSISKPIHILQKGTERIGSGDLDYRIKINTKDEIGQLARSFNRMSGALRRDITTLKKAEEHIEHLNSVLKAIRNVNQLIIVEKDRDSLLQKACDVLIETRGYDAAWLGFLRDSKTFITVKGSGFMEDLSRFREHLIGGEHPPCFKNAFAQKDTFKLVDKSIECGDCFFKNAHHIDKEVAIMRVEHAGRLFGLLAVSFTPGVIADEEEKGLLKEVAGDIAFALHDMKQEDTRKKAEEALRTSEAFLTEIGRIAKVGGWEIDAKTLELSLTEETYRIYEIPLGTKPPLEKAIDFFHPNDRPKLKTAIQRALEHGETFDMELRFITAKDKHLWTHAICKPITMDGKTVKLTGTFQDITEYKELENKLKNYTKDLEKGIEERTKELVVANKHLEKANHSKSEFLANMSHELRTPLNAIIGFSEVLKDESFGPLNNKQKEYTNDIHESGEHLLSLINDILDLSKVEAGKVKLELTDFDLKVAIENSLSMIKEKAMKQGITISKEIKDDIVMINADERKLKQILFNLLSNAVKFIPEGGMIGIEAKRVKGKILISVWDTGIGIEDKDKDKVFQEFQQIDSSYSRKYAGTGLGLPLTKKLVELHGGKIWFQSEGKDKGTRFSFILPQYSSEQILHRNMELKISSAIKDKKELSLFVISFTNFPEIEEEIGEEKSKAFFFKSIQALKNAISANDLVMERGMNEIIVLTEIKKENVSQIKKRIWKATKNTIFEIEGNVDVNFSCGVSFCPDDGKSNRDLLDKAIKNLVSEKGPRLNKNIMIVDDDPVVINILQQFLKEYGYNNFTAATSGKDALEKLKSIPHDLIIIDLMMPGMSGYEVIGRLKENIETKDMPVIIISGYEVETDKLQDSDREKAIPVIHKPFDIKYVKKIVEFLL